MSRIFSILFLLVIPILAKGGFVKSCGRDFCVDGKKWVPVGFNAYWLGLDEEYRYPSFKRIEEMFEVAKKMSATAIRAHTLGHSSGSKVSLRPWDRNLNNNAWKPLSKKEFWTNRVLIDDFKDYIYKYLNHVNQFTGVAIKNDPALFLIETGNELGNIRNQDNSIPPKSWIQEITDYIRSIDKNHLILDGVDESLGKSDNFHVPNVNVFSRHFYSEDYNALHARAADAANVGKPLIVGEFSMEKEENVKGTFFWSMFGHDDNGNWIRHNDGFSLYYKEDSSYKDLLKLANHARRMQGLSEIS
eukprot:CAMPEP_0176471918 /NCGR_PEP_ID=MMETSP0127-20121128/41432_1 /TAXON_ID=938130 /ORGANISM="Platyophrya macrostoma, Strain WH" /LENGTH=301 /DNA_ID=CAMNT_0017866685 /DNA_START=9 /DNA_END=911 /DNA_ORIENTATION=+